MAKSVKLMSVLTLVFLVIMILSHEGMVIEARHLKCKKGTHATSHRNSSKTVTASSRNEHAEISSKPRNGKSLVIKEDQQLSMSDTLETLDDFRPTVPGRSPGAGH